MSVKLQSRGHAWPNPGPSECEPGTVVLWCHGKHPQEAATHCFLRAEATTLCDPLDGQPRLRQQTSRGLHPQPLNGAGRRLPGRLGVVAAETALAHARLIGQNRKRKFAFQMAVNPVMERTEPILRHLQGEGRAELRLAAGAFEENNQVAG